MNKSLSTMKTNVANEVQDTTASMKSLVENYLNERYFQVLRAINWQNIRNNYAITTVAGTQEYALPDDFKKEVVVVDDTNGRELTKTDWQRLIMDRPDTHDETGTVANYYIREDTVRAQPTSDSVITVVSSSAADTTQEILIRGLVNGIETTEEVTLIGTSNASTTAQFTRVKAISKSGNTVGYITVTSNSGAVTLAVLAPKILESRCTLIGFHYIPSTAATIGVSYIIKPMPMTEDYDYPIIDIADVLECGAKADAWRYKRQFAKANVFETLFTSKLSEFIWDKENDMNRIYQFSPSTFNKDNLY